MWEHNFWLVRKVYARGCRTDHATVTDASYGVDRGVEWLMWTSATCWCRPQTIIMEGAKKKKKKKKNNRMAAADSLAHSSGRRGTNLHTIDTRYWYLINCPTLFCHLFCVSWHQYFYGALLPSFLICPSLTLTVVMRAILHSPSQLSTFVRLRHSCLTAPLVRAQAIDTLRLTHADA